MLELTSEEQVKLKAQFVEVCRTWYGMARPESAREHVACHAATLVLLFEYDVKKVLYVLAQRAVGLWETDRAHAELYDTFVHRVLSEVSPFLAVVYKAWFLALLKQGYGVNKE